MAIAYVGNGGTAKPSVTQLASTATLSPAGTLAAGDLVILFIALKTQNGRTISSVTDNSAGTANAWQVDATPVNGTDAVAICSCVLASQILSTDTITIHGSGAWGLSAIMDVDIEEYSGADATTWFDVGATATGTGTALTAGTTASATAGDLGVAAWATLVAQTSWTKATGYTDLGIVSQLGLALLAEHKLNVSGAQSATGTAGTTGTWAGAQATYIAAVSTPAKPRLLRRRPRLLRRRLRWPQTRTGALLLSSVKPFTPSPTKRRAALRRPILRRHRWPQTRTVRLLLSSVKPFTPIATRAKLRRPIRRRLRPRPIQSAAILLATVKPIGTPGTSDTTRPKLRRPMRRRQRPVQVTTPQLLLSSVQPFEPEPARARLRRPIRRRFRPVQIRTVAGLVSTSIPFIPRSTRLKLRRPFRRRTRPRAAYSLVNLTAVQAPLPFPARPRLRRPMRRRQRPVQTRTPSLLLAGVKPLVPLLRRRRPVWLGRRRPHPQGVALALYYAIPPFPFRGVPNRHRSRSLGPHRKIRQTPAASLRMTPQAAPFRPAGVTARAKLRRPIGHRRPRVQGVSRAVRTTVAPPFHPRPRVRRARPLRHNRAHPARQNLALYLTPPGQQPTLPLLGVGL